MQNEPIPYSVNGAPIDLRQPLKIAPDQGESWVNFKDPVTFDHACNLVMEAAQKDGERQDLGIASLGGWAFGPGPGGVAALATIPSPGREHHMVPLRRQAFSQLCGRIGAPAKYIASLPAKLQVVNVNHGLQQSGDNTGNLLRLAGGEARALLSDRYAALDNEMMLDALRNTLHESGMLDDVRVRAVAVGPTCAIRLTMPGDDVQIGARKVNDIIETGLDVLNGEVGNRAVNINSITWRLICLNGMRSADRKTKASLRHVGDPRRLHEAFRDALPAALNGAQKMRDRMVGAVDMIVDDLMNEFGALAAFGLTAGEVGDVARDVMAERELTLPQKTDDWPELIRSVEPASVYDVVNGITHIAQRRGVDRRLELEEAAGGYLRRATRR